MPRLTVLGSTGSIGTNTLSVIRQNSHLYQVYGLAAGRNVNVLADQILEFRPSVVAVPDSKGSELMVTKLTELGLTKSEWPELTLGPQALVAIGTANEVDVLISAIVGVTGLRATYEAVRVGKRVRLAN